MPVQITIVGLGQIGTSIGLALKARGANVYLVGHDKDAGSAKAAQAAGAVDTFKFNLPASVENAQIVILALPFGEVRETLKVIGLDLQEGALVLDTALAKGAIAEWANEFIPQGRFYVGLYPAIHPDRLLDMESGVKSASADLFERAVTVITAPLGTPENVFKLSSDFVTLLGSTPLFMDSTEADGYLGKVQIIPQLAAAALLDSTLDQPGWQEGQKLAGKPYATMTSALTSLDDVASLSGAALANRENVVRLLNSYITSLIDIRDEIEDNDGEALLKRLENNWNGRARWMEERLKADWQNIGGQGVDGQSFGDRMSQMFLGSAMSKRGKQRK